MEKVAVVISPNYKNYAKRFLDSCIKSVNKQTYQAEIKIFLADNESNEESFLFLQKTAPEAEIIRNKDNAGFAKGNNVCIRKALSQGFSYIVLLNMDTEIDTECLKNLIKTAKNNDKVGSVQARLMRYGQKNIINSMGCSTHFLGFGYCLGNGEELTKNKNLKTTTEIMYPSGAAVLFKRQVLEKTGLFDEKFWMYNEDQELGWRILLAGYKNILCPQAVVYHKYEFARSIKNYYWMDRNRLISILTCYQMSTILFILPALIFMEIGLLLFSLKTGWFKEKLKVWMFFISFSNWKYILNKRKKNQAQRTIKDKDIFYLFSGHIWYQEINDWKLRLINPFFNFYWRTVKSILKTIN